MKKQVNNFRPDTFFKNPEKVYHSNSFGTFIVKDYLNAKNVDIEFTDTGYRNTVEAVAIRGGRLRDNLLPTVKGVGYVGICNYKPVVDVKCYEVWEGMLERCYCSKYQSKQPTYIGCSVDSYWHNFQNFAKWFYEESNYSKGLYLDKDILVQGNKIYSPENCIFVSRAVNNLFTERGNRRGKYMLGVCKDRRYPGLVASCNNGDGVPKYLGTFTSEVEAHNTYKEYKYKVIHQVANKQKNNRVKEALLSWVIPMY